MAGAGLPDPWRDEDYWPRFLEGSEMVVQDPFGEWSKKNAKKQKEAYLLVKAMAEGKWDGAICATGLREKAQEIVNGS